MNPQENPNWNRKLEELEREINQISSSSPLKTPSEKLLLLLNKITDWFKGLSDVGKIAAISAGALVGLMMLKTFLQLVTSMISLAVLSVLIYFGYKYFLTKKDVN